MNTTTKSRFSKIQPAMLNLERALSRLKEALGVPENHPLAIDGTIQRFEFAFELCWKTLKKFLAEEGLEGRTPRETLRQAYAAGWLEDEEKWLSMLQDRNETSHVYDESKARMIYTNIKNNFAAMEKALVKLKEKMIQPTSNPTT